MIFVDASFLIALLISTDHFHERALEISETINERKVINNTILANFKLSDDDQKLLITNGKKIIDEVNLVKLIDNVSYGRVEDKWYYFTKPTPGEENNTVALEKIEDRKEVSQ